MKTSRIVGTVAAATLAAAAFTGAAVAFAADDTSGTTPAGQSGPADSTAQRPGGHGPGERGPGGHGPGERGPGEHGPGEYGPSGHGPGERGAGGHGERGQLLHGESVVETEDGTYVTQRMQVGDVTAVSATSLTVRSEDGFTAAYVLDDQTELARDDAEGTAPKVGDRVHVHASVAGSAVTAEGVFALSPERAAELDEQREEMERWMSERPDAPGRQGEQGQGEGLQGQAQG